MSRLKPGRLRELKIKEQAVLGFRPELVNARGRKIAPKALVEVWIADDETLWFSIEAVSGLLNRSIQRTRDAMHGSNRDPQQRRRVRTTGAPMVALSLGLVKTMFDGCRPNIARQVRPWFDRAVARLKEAPTSTPAPRREAPRKRRFLTRDDVVEIVETELRRRGFAGSPHNGNGAR